jgi:hypothetical protein
MAWNISKSRTPRKEGKGGECSCEEYNCFLLLSFIMGILADVICHKYLLADAVSSVCQMEDAYGLVKLAKRG